MIPYIISKSQYTCKMTHQELLRLHNILYATLCRKFYIVVDSETKYATYTEADSLDAFDIKIQEFRELIVINISL